MRFTVANTKNTGEVGITLFRPDRIGTVGKSFLYKIAAYTTDKGVWKGQTRG